METNPLDYKQLYDELLIKYEKLLHKNQKQERRLEKIMHQSDMQTKELLKLNEALQKAANTDPMTKAYNRRFFYEKAEQILQTSNKQLSIAILDIDKFKAINDTYGHDVGDVIIKHLANTIRDYILPGHLFARFGGEEFVILFHSANKKESINFCDNLRKIIEQSTPSKQTKYTVSIGVTHILPNETTLEQSLKRADIGLYIAKENGRNKVEYYLKNDCGQNHITF